MEKLALLIISLSIQPLIVHGLDPIMFSCSNVKANPQFNNSKTKIFSDLRTAFPSTLFSILTSNLGQNVPDTAYGLAQCKNVTHQDCKACVLQAVDEIQRRCPSDTAGKIWYDKCFFRYSNELFFGKVDHNDDEYILSGPVVNDTRAFNDVIDLLMTTMASNVAWKPTSIMYTHDFIYYGQRLVYGMALCTMDLSEKACTDCVEYLAKQLPARAYGSENVRVLGTSCMVRYSFEDFIRVK